MASVFLSNDLMALNFEMVFEMSWRFAWSDNQLEGPRYAPPPLKQLYPDRTQFP